MRLYEISSNNLATQTMLTESWDYLTEDQKVYLNRFETELWPLVENLKHLLEADLTVDQIQQVFQSAEEVSANFGGKTKLGKAAAVAKLPVDAMKAVNKKVNELGKLLQDTQPVKNFDAQFEKLKGDIVAKAGDNNKLVTMVQKYGEWAKENPGKSAFAVGVLTAAASFAAGPAGGAAVGFLLRSASELTKGEKLSTVAGKAAKTAAIGGLAGLSLNSISDAIADNIMNASAADIDAQAQALEGAKVEDALSAVKADYADVIPNNMEEYRHITLKGHVNNFQYDYDVYVSPEHLDKVRELKDAIKNAGSMGGDEWVKTTASFHDYMSTLQQSPAQADMHGFVAALETAKDQQLDSEQIKQLLGEYESAEEAYNNIKKAGGALAAAAQAGAQQADQLAKAATKASPPKSKDESNESIQEAFCFDGEILSEADTFGGAMKRGISRVASKAGGIAAKGASKAGAAIKKGAKNVGYKVTADKLAKKWKEVGSPTDVASILKLLGKFGVTTEQLASIEQKANVPLQKAKSDTSSSPRVKKIADKLAGSEHLDAIKSYLTI